MAIFYTTTTGAGTKAGGSWANAFSEPEMKAYIEASAAPGDKFYMAGGTYTITSNYIATLRDGTAPAPISLIGVKSGTTAEEPTVSDWAYSTERPLVECGVYNFSFADYWMFFNLRLTSLSTTSVQYYLGNAAYNCKVTQLAGGAERAILIGGNYVRLIGVEAISSAGPAVTGGSYYIYVNGCYFHDSLSGINMGIHSTVINSIIANMTDYGIAFAAAYNVSICNNTFYKCGTGVLATSAYWLTMLNNIFKGNTIGAQWTTEQKINRIDFNCWDNVTDVVNCSKGANCITADPQLNDPDNGDYTLKSSSPCLNAGVDANVAGANI